MRFGTSGEIEGLALQPDHKIVAAGWTFTVPGEDFALARFNPDGSLDPSFGDGGKAATDFTTGDEGHAVVVQPDGKIVVAGQSLANYALARYRPDGSLDPSFGSGGKVLSSIQGEQGPLGGASALVLQPDGKLVAVGNVYLASRHQFGALRFNTDGSLGHDLRLRRHRPRRGRFRPLEPSQCSDADRHRRRHRIVRWLPGHARSLPDEWGPRRRLRERRHRHHGVRHRRIQLRRGTRPSTRRQDPCHRYFRRPGSR
jgi:uncharacterized delta-60 repeat protein